MKRKLFFLLALMLTSISTWAQGTWDAPVVPGVDLSTWDNSSKVYIYNVEADAFVCAGMNWNTNAISTRLTNGDTNQSGNHSAAVTVNGSTIKMVMDANTGRAIGTNGGDFDCWIDFDHNQDWTFAASEKYTNAYTLINTAYAGKKLDVAALYGGKLTIGGGKGLYDWAFIPVASITDGSYLKYKEKKAMYGVYQALVMSGKTSTYATALETANAVYTNGSATAADLRAATRALIIAAADGIESRIDASSLFTNADMVGAASSSDWNSSQGISWATFEKYHGNITLTQGKTDVPNGLYDVEFQGFFRQDGSNDAPVLTVNNGSSDQSSNVVEMREMAATWGCNANGGNNWKDQGGKVIPDGMKSAGQGLAYEGTISSVNDVAVKGNSLTISTIVNSSSQWFIWQGYRIYYKGPVNLALYNEIMTRKGVAEGLISTAPSETSKAMLENAIAEASVLTPNSDEEDLTKALNDLNTAIAFANESGGAYDAFDALKIAADALVAVPNDNSEANATLAAVISAQTAVVASATTVEGINTATSTLKAAMITYAGAANPTDEAQPFNLTFMIKNPDLTNYASWATGIEGWSSEQEDGNKNVMHNGGVACEKGDAFYEYWSWTAKANDKFNLYNLVENLPVGTYTISCYAFARQQDGETGNPTVAGLYFYANDTQGGCVNDNNLTAKTISFVNKAAQDVKIGLKPVSTGNSYNWMGIGYLGLYKVPAKTYTVYEDQDWDYSTSGAGDVTLNRTIKAGINSLVLPFSMTQAEVEDKFGEGSKVYVVSSYDSDTNNITFVSQEGIFANRPCLLEATVAGDSYEFADRTVTPAASAAPEYVLESVSMIGGYNATNAIANAASNYVISDGKIYLVDNDGVNMKGTRAYINIPNGNNARELILNLDGETAINAIDAAETETEGLKDGKFLIGGKIVIVNNGVKYNANGQILK